MCETDNTPSFIVDSNINKLPDAYQKNNHFISIKIDVTPMKLLKKANMSFSSSSSSPSPSSLSTSSKNSKKKTK